MRTIEHWINGSLTPLTSTQSSPVFNPATGEQQAAVRLAGKSDVDTAVAATAKAFESWQNSSLSKRMRVMFAFRELLVKHEDELARIISAEHGKVIDDARGEIVRGREVVEYACGIGEVLKGGYSDQVSTDVDVHSFRQPLGVCAGITPSTSRSWCRAGCTRSPSPPATPSCSNPASATPPPRTWWPSSTGKQDSRRRVQRRAGQQDRRRRDPGPPRHRRRLLRRLHADRQVRARARHRKR
jgi:hypothetical protein